MISTTLTSSDSLILNRTEVYDPQNQAIWPFKHVDDIVEGITLDLCNMVSYYPFEVDGIKWRSSEELYLAGEFSNNTPEHLAIQEELRASRSAYAAKLFVKGKHRRKVREDFPEFRTQWMLWVVWQKCKGNADFRRKLLSIPDDVTLVEETTTDTGGTGHIWGCSNKELIKARKEVERKLIEENTTLLKKDLRHLINIKTNEIRNVGVFEGQNNIGKILMICRECIKQGSEPEIDYTLLRSKNIYILGKQINI